MAVYISEYNVFTHNGGDFVEVVAPTGTDLSGYSFYVYASDGTVEAGPFTFGPPVGTQSGKDIFVIDNNTPAFDISVDKGLVLVDDFGSVVQYLTYANQVTTAVDGPAAGQTSQPTTAAASGQSVQSDDGGATYFNQPNKNKGSIPCFAAGTWIMTPAGARRVEDISIGERVSTAGGGSAKIVWTTRRAADRGDFEQAGFPIEIRAHALGPGCPEHPLIVSPQHRILVGGRGPLRKAFEVPCLVPAKALLGLDGIYERRHDSGVVWHHFAFDKHALVLAQGCVTESLLLGPMFVQGLMRSERRRLEMIFPGALRERAHLNGPPAAPLRTVGAARRALEISGWAGHGRNLERLEM